MAVALAVALALGWAAGRAHRPKPLAPAPEAVAASEHFVAVFGNSIFQTAVDPGRLAVAVGARPGAVAAELYSGAGWGSLHYYMLALFARDVLRPRRDLAVIDISLPSLHDADHRLAGIRPAAARAVAEIPGLPVETRLDVLFGAISPLYRYRMPLQSRIAADLERALRRGAAAGSGRRLLGPPPGTKSFRLVTEADADFVTAWVGTDNEADRLVIRRRVTDYFGGMNVGEFKLTALERAVRALRERDIPVALVLAPLASWCEALLPPDFTGQARRRIDRLARDTGALVLTEWPAQLREERRFGDGYHMAPDATAPFTDELGKRLRAALSW